MSLDLRCRRCNVPHARHPDANKNGGVGYILRWQGDLCPVCRDKRGEQEERALWRVLEYRRRSIGQESLSSYESE